MTENVAAEYWHIRAAEIASIAKIAGDDQDRQDLLRIAADTMAKTCSRKRRVGSGSAVTVLSPTVVACHARTMCGA
jgi:hypothetical protein